MAVRIRRAEEADFPAMVALSERRIEAYARERPDFWRKAADSAEQYARHLANHLARDRVIVLVADEAGAVRGYLVGVLIPAPPVYDPAGDTSLVDSFAVAGPDSWETIGAERLRAVDAEARSRGAAQLVVVCGHHEEPKRRMLASTGASVVSEWWHRAL